MPGISPLPSPSESAKDGGTLIEDAPLPPRRVLRPRSVVGHGAGHFRGPSSVRRATRGGTGQGWPAAIAALMEVAASPTAASRPSTPSAEGCCPSASYTGCSAVCCCAAGPPGSPRSRRTGGVRSSEWGRATGESVTLEVASTNVRRLRSLPAALAACAKSRISWHHPSPDPAPRCRSSGCRVGSGDRPCARRSSSCAHPGRTRLVCRRVCRRCPPRSPVGDALLPVQRPFRTALKPHRAPTRWTIRSLRGGGGGRTAAVSAPGGPGRRR